MYKYDICLRSIDLKIIRHISYIYILKNVQKLLKYDKYINIITII